MMDPELLETIKGTIARINYLANSDLRTAKREIEAQKRQLNFLRKHLSIYKEYDSIDNLELLGESYIKKMKRELTPLVFLTSIMNKKIDKLENGFYANLSSKIHYYDAYDNSFLNNIRTSHGSLDLSNVKSKNYRYDSDVNGKNPLFVAFDYNANINWIVTGQPYSSELKTLSSFYVKNERKLRELIQDWAAYYLDHPIKKVVYFYDQTALHGSYASDSESFSTIVMDEFAKQGWNCEGVYIGQAMRHDLKHQYINDALTGVKYLFPVFNRNNNEFLLPAMEQTAVKVGRNGFEKDKSGEKLEETEEDPLELRTDGTDAWDTLFIGINFFKHSFSDALHYGNVFID